MVLRKLWYGDIAPSVRSIRGNTPYALAGKQLVAEEQKLRHMMNDSEIKIFEAFEACHDKMTSIELEEAFISGFRLGTRMLVEAMTDSDSQFEADV